MRSFKGAIPFARKSDFGSDNLASSTATVSAFDEYRWGEKYDIQTINLTKNRRLYRLGQKFDSIPLYRGDVVVVFDDNALLEFYGTPISRPKKISYSLTDVQAKAIVIGKYGKISRIYRVSKTIYNCHLVDQSCRDSSIAAWSISADAGGNSPLMEIVIDGNSGSILYTKKYQIDALEREVWLNANPIITTDSTKRSEGQGACGIAHVDSEYTYMGNWYRFFSKYRDGADNNGMPMWSSVDEDLSGCPNAYSTIAARSYKGKDVTAVVTDFCSSMVYDDISYHEWTHGLTFNTANFSSMLNVGDGLNEGFSDAFACLISKDWTLGEKVNLPGTVRYPITPSNDGMSINSYSGYTSTIDAHYLAGLVSHPAWVLTEGNGADAIGHGYETASDIYYETLIRLSANSTFYDYAKMLVSVAKDYSYGPHSVACAAYIAVNSEALAQGISSDVCSDNTKNMAVLLVNNWP